MFVKLWMQRDVVTVAQECSIEEARALLEEKGFRHLPVVEGDKLVGIITKTDIKKAMPSAIDSSVSPQDRLLAAQAKVAAFMTTSPVTASPMDPLEEIALLMRRFKIGAIPVVEGETLKGIITESDIFQAFTEILGAAEEGARIELQIEHQVAAIYSVIDICKRFRMNLIAITVYRNFSPEHQLLTLRVSGDQVGQLVDELWQSGVKVNRVSMDTEEDA